MAHDFTSLDGLSEVEKKKVVDAVAKKNVARVVAYLLTESRVIANLLSTGKIAVVGVMYDITTGNLKFLPEAVVNLALPEITSADEAIEKVIFDGISQNNN